jgi:hypothetical protein
MKRLLGAMVIVSMAIIAGRYAYLELSRLPLFRLSKVEINCPDHINKADVLRISGLEIGKSIFNQDIDKATNSLLEIAGVQAIEVKRLLPALIRIQLEADEVVLFVKGDIIYGLTQSQKLVTVMNNKNILPMVTGLNVMKSRNNLTGHPESFELNYSDRVMLCYAIETYEGLKTLSENLADRLSEMHFAGSSRVELFFDPGGLKVVLPLRGRQKALFRLSVLDFNGILGNSGSFDMTGGRMVVKSGV